MLFKTKFLCSMIGLFLLPGITKGQQNKLPNVIVILVDDLGYGELGCQGNHQIPTPNIDSIAANGVRFTQGYVTSPVCSTSRAGLLTGRHQERFGYTTNLIGAANDEPNAGLPLQEKTIANYLSDSGFITGLFGKWHLGATSKYLPLRRGFDEFFGFLHEGHFYTPPPHYDVVSWLRRKVIPGGGQGRFFSRDGRTIYSSQMGTHEPSYDAGNPIYRNGQPVEEKQHLTEAISREAKEFILRNFDKPFFMCVHYNAVHSPMQGADRYMHKFRNIEDPQRRIFLAMLGHLDDGVGQILGALRQIGDTKNTLILFLSDNGGPTRELTSSNAPLRGEKGQLYEGGIRVPFLMQWKNKIPAETVFQQPVSSLDLNATLQSIVGFEPKHKLDGVDLLPYVQGNKTGRPHDRLYWRSKNQTALRSGDWKIVSTEKPSKEIRYEVFDLASDIAEENNLADANPQRLEALQKELQTASMDYRWTSPDRKKGAAEKPLP